MIYMLLQLVCIRSSPGLDCIGSNPAVALGFQHILGQDHILMINMLLQLVCIRNSPSVTFGHLCHFGHSGHLIGLGYWNPQIRNSSHSTFYPFMLWGWIANIVLPGSCRLYLAARLYCTPRHAGWPSSWLKVLSSSKYFYHSVQALPVMAVVAGEQTDIRFMVDKLL